MSRKTPQTFEPASGPVKERTFAVFDLESKDGNSQRRGFTRPFVVGFYDGKEFIGIKNEPYVKNAPWFERAITRGGCIDLFMRHLLGPLEGSAESPYRDYDIYAHNMGGFDGLFLPAWLERNNQHVSYKIMHVQSRIQVCEIWKFNKNRYRGSEEARKRATKKDREQYGVIRILDSFRIMPSSLDKLAKAFGLGGKLKEVEGQEFNLDLHEEDPLWDAYNKVDCELLYEIIRKYKELVYKLGGDVGITAPSTAVKLLQRKYLPDPSDYVIQRNLHFQDCNNEQCPGCAHQFFRSAYFGGRTELYLYKLIGWYWDINSSYPYSMKRPMPVGEMIELGPNQDFSRYSNDTENYVGFVRCTVEIPEGTYLPPLPVQHGGKLKFPSGRFSGTWDWVELAALKRVGGRILHVEKSVWIVAKPFLRKYVEDLYWLRNKKNPDWSAALSELAKIMMNSTFGKLGMAQQREEIIILKPGEPEPWMARYPGESEDHRQQRKKAAAEGDHSYHVTVPLPEEPKENFEKRRKAERKGDFKSYRWRMPELPGGSGIYEHDSLVRIRDVHVDAAYIIPHIAAHITASSRILLWAYSMDIISRCQTCQTCGRPFRDHQICTKCGRSVIEHNDLPEGDERRTACMHFTPVCKKFVRCELKKDEHDGAGCQFCSNDIAYSDTDSVICNFPDYPDSTELGGLKKEHDGQMVMIECFAPKMYKITMSKPIPGEHMRGPNGKRCEEFCPGCLKDQDGKLIKGQHAMKNGERQCAKEKGTCPGCSYVKIMMKGIPKDMRTSETVASLREGGSVSYTQLEKLGAIAKRGFRETPRTHVVEKTMKSKYDKRETLEDQTTKPITLDGDRYLSEMFLALPRGYVVPKWLEKVLEPFENYE